MFCVVGLVQLLVGCYYRFDYLIYGRAACGFWLMLICCCWDVVVVGLGCLISWWILFGAARLFIVCGFSFCGCFRLAGYFPFFYVDNVG